MKKIKSIGFLIFWGLTLLGCVTEKPPQIVTVEVTRVIERTVLVTPQPSHGTRDSLAGNFTQYSKDSSYRNPIE